MTLKCTACFLAVGDQTQAEEAAAVSDEEGAGETDIEDISSMLQ
jgi:hypothetical protein